ncbi:hypothetical protein HD806DRAFT_486918 [Xylariaceae sp. AK1471]|nr:hypothetical protein HD806DRAFT_486918 [Xylariaceae sp. AK1471]
MLGQWTFYGYRTYPSLFSGHRRLLWFISSSFAVELGAMPMDIGVSQATSESHYASHKLPYSRWNAFVEAYKETFPDLQINKFKFALGVMCAIWLLGLLVALGFLVLFGVLPSLSLDSTRPSACHPDGKFSPFGQTYNPWALIGFFQINLAFGNLTFTDVKVIDVLWDIVIGRGGQAAMAFVSWRVFADYIATSAVTKPVTFITFRATFLESTPSLVSTYRMARDLIFRRGFDSKSATIFIVWSMLFILGWPTFAGAATGYTPTTKAFILNYDDNFVPFSYFRPLAYIIHDGTRMNLTKDYLVPLLSILAPGDPIIHNHNSFKFQHEYTCRVYSQALSLPWDPLESVKDNCLMAQFVSDYTAKNGFRSTSYQNTTWAASHGTGILLGPPSLNIEAFSIAPENWEDSEIGLYGWDWTDPRLGYTRPFSNRSRTTWTFSNKTYSLSYIEDNGQCQPIQDRFKWGFSYLQIFIIVIALLSWTLGTCILWLKSHFLLPFQDELEVPRGYTALLLFADTIDEQLSGAGFDTQFLTNNQFNTEIQKSLQGGAISFKASLSPETIWDWLAEDWPWLLALAAHVMTTIALSSAQVVLLGRRLEYEPPATVSQIFREYGYMLHTPWGAALWWICTFALFSSLGLLVAIIIGKSTKTRILVTSCFTWIGLVAALITSLFAI